MEAISSHDHQVRAASVISTLSLPELAFISRNYTTALSLAECMADELKPIAADSLDFGCPAAIPSGLTSTEKIRLLRALLRYQLMCELLYPARGTVTSAGGDIYMYESEASYKHVAERDKNRKIFFQMYPPWVNEHLISHGIP
jgi:hypothetical protein